MPSTPPVYELKASLFRVLGHPARVRILELLRDGESIYYTVEDERVFELLAAGRAIITRQLATQQSLLRELAAE